jgi:hypothetical protein
LSGARFPDWAFSIFFAAALSPVGLLGRKTRGFIALSLTFVNGLGGWALVVLL